MMGWIYAEYPPNEPGKYLVALLLPNDSEIHYDLAFYTNRWLAINREGKSIDPVDGSTILAWMPIPEFRRKRK